MSRQTLLAWLNYIAGVLRGQMAGCFVTIELQTKNRPLPFKAKNSIAIRFTALVFLHQQFHPGYVFEQKQKPFPSFGRFGQCWHQSWPR